MRQAFLVFFTVCAIAAQAQNELITPAGQALRLDADNVSIKQKVTLNSDSGYVSIGGYRLIGIKKAATGELSTFAGPKSGNFTMTGRSNAFMGENSGAVVTSGYGNLAMGRNAGALITTGYQNVLAGEDAGALLAGGYFNTVVGSGAGHSTISGQSNVFLGLSTGYENNSSANVFIGRAANYFTAGGSKNVSIGFGAGSGTGATNTNGAGNILIGNRAGYYETGDNKLYIANSNTTTPIIYGEFPTASPSYVGKLIFNTRAGVGVTTFPTTVMVGTVSTNVSAFKMFVNGGMVARNHILTGAGAWADYVFEEGYPLKSLNEVEAFIRVNGHLPKVPSAGQVDAWGIDVGKMTRLQQEKIEELTLYVIAQNKRMDGQKGRIEAKKAQVIKLLKEMDRF
ncbi:hypothetical protein LZD49_26450 [Dyadobacter sp. CY261]|uniref:hypothetical protein n=1 Tax=Dyadobacter sp. CY261 TaxID=2907203 RepID=UPI001F2CDDB8|nr:hypothetical protein [Dyadobacter sp. CY261]MCF0074051.1 hypothetical protein [Dyadobacter sp. CY261]